MHEGVIPHPPSEPLIIIRQWQVEACEGNLCAAALMSFFEYWHNLKLANQKQAKDFNDTSEKHGRQRDQLESLYQWHSTEALQKGILGLYGETLIQKSVKLLEKLGFISIHKNPNQDYKWDKTNFYLFHPEPVIAWLREHKGIEVHLPHETPVNTDAVEVRHPCREKEAIDWHKNTAAITECTYEKEEKDTPENTDVFSIPHVEETSEPPKKTRRKSAKKYKPPEWSVGYHEFIKLYPRYVAVDKGWDAWEDMNLDTQPALVVEIMEKLKEQCTWYDWKKDGHRFCPYPATYLHERRWLDKAPARASPDNVDPLTLPLNSGERARITKQGVV